LNPPTGAKSLLLEFKYTLYSEPSVIQLPTNQMQH